jgi:cell division protein FtsB
MPAPIEPKAAPRRESGAEPLRRKRAQPVPAVSMRRRRILNALLAFATVVLLVDALVGDTGLVERTRARRRLQAAEAALAGLHQQNTDMREEMRRLKDDPDLLEAVAREELGLIRPGELLFIVRDAKPASSN